MRFNYYKGKVIAVDFDDTLAITNYPHIIRPNIQVVSMVRKLKRNGAIIILWTCREGEPLKEAINWCKEHNIPIDFINENAPYRIEQYGSDCRKIGYDLLIDDKTINPWMKLHGKRKIRRGKNMEITVIKRDGSKVPYELSKIKTAISKAYIECFPYATNNEENINCVADKINENINNILKYNDIKEINIETIQDIVEDILISENIAEVAKAYITYRYK